MSNFLTAALYKFVSLPDYAALQQPLLDKCNALGIKGTLLLAEEGINGTVSGLPENIRALLDHLRSDPRLATLEHKESWAEEMPFYRMKVRLKKEIVKLGVPGVDPNKMAGHYVKPEDWNALISDPDVVVIDTRNDYEVGIGTFKGAINPRTNTFTELPQWVEAHKDVLDKPKVAMFCTGGIRCEKSTAYLRSLGYDEVYHLEGGILKYLETVPEEQSLWQGECFVFDERVSVKHGLEQGSYEFCRACRQPIGAEDKASPLYEEGVSCPHCHGTKTEEQLKSAAERQRQIELAKKRGEQHIGAAFKRKPKPAAANTPESTDPTASTPSPLAGEAWPVLSLSKEGEG